MAKRKISDIETGAGFFLGFVSVMMDVVREKACPFAAIHRLVTPGGRMTIGKIVELAHADWQAEQSQPTDVLRRSLVLPPNHYRVHVSYAPMPSLAELKREFGEDRVSDIFDGREWELHASCADMDRTPGERIFYLHNVGRAWRREEQIAWGLKQRNVATPKGYRPATHGETFEFSRAHPELVDYVGLGSSALHGVSECVARVWSQGSRRILVSVWVGRGFGAGDRVLFVSK